MASDRPRATTEPAEQSTDEKAPAQDALQYEPPRLTRIGTAEQLTRGASAAPVPDTGSISV